MRRPFTVLAATALLGAVPAGATPVAEPLVDLAPQSTGFRDHVGPGRAASRAVQYSPAAAYAAPDGQTVSVRFSRSYPDDPAIAQSYVDFLGGLAHGSELARLKITIATPAEVRALCGGVKGTLACYDPSVSRMTVPGEQTADGGSGVTTSYVMAHEYGHHIARWRDNRPFPALNFGPRYWASYELVCLNTLRGRLVPGDQGERYLDNPGEGWADTYAHLKYPDVGWQYTPVLRPSKASKAAALRDVIDPWTAQAREVFSGRFAPGGPDVQVFQMELTLDGSLRITLAGPDRANFDIEVESLGVNRGETHGPAARDNFRATFACREVDSERVLVKIRRERGFGKFTATVTYAG